MSVWASVFGSAFFRAAARGSALSLFDLHAVRYHFAYFVALWCQSQPLILVNPSRRLRRLENPYTPSMLHPFLTL
jgi:hypothetical protein